MLAQPALELRQHVEDAFLGGIALDLPGGDAGRVLLFYVGSHAGFEAGRERVVRREP